jgi:hypothetical protein
MKHEITLPDGKTHFAVGDGFIWDGSKFIHVAPNMCCIALVDALREIELLKNQITEIGAKQ